MAGPILLTSGGAIAIQGSAIALYDQAALEDCCCDFECPDCEWFKECFVGKEAHVRIEDVANGDGCDCTDINTTWIVEMTDDEGFNVCGAQGVGNFFGASDCGDVGWVVLLGTGTPFGGGDPNTPLLHVNGGLTGIGGGGTWEDTGCEIAEQLCAGIEVELPLVAHANGLCTWSSARCFLQLLPP